MSNTIKVGFCIAYDWYLLHHALPLIYTSADQICLSLDKNRVSWSGAKFHIDDQAFRLFVNQIDVDNKIQILEEDYCIPSLTPGQNEVRQRNHMATRMGIGGWHIQLDCDEYFSDFPGFVSYLNNLSERDRIRTNICCPLLTLFKKTDKGYLYIEPKSASQVEFIQIATQQPHYEFGRRNGDFNIYTKYDIVHQSWARSEEEIKSKLSNWGHSRDFDGAQYFETWKAVDQINYASLRDFHPIQPALWPSLSFTPEKNIDDFLQKFKWQSFPYSPLRLKIKNSRLLAKLKKLVSLITT